MNSQRKIAVIGLGYVGLPVAAAFAKAGFPTIGFDINTARIAELRAGRDRTNELTAEDIAAANIRFASDPAALAEADFFIVTVPTPIDAANRPDLTAVKSASRTVGAALKRGDIVVFESTVYPGCTEDDCVPILEATSGLKAGADFGVGYSPERINPGDREHRFSTIAKVVSGDSDKTARIVAQTYGAVVTAGVHIASSIKVAEAAKVIENTQRDLNIALMNEFSLILRRMNVDTLDVLEAAGTKWNFLKFTPGLVGGHCIGVDPYYLTYKAQMLGIHPEVVLAGRRVNDEMGRLAARECIRALVKRGRPSPRVAVLGLTFKENVPDVRNSKSFDVIDELQRFGIDVVACDPLADPAETLHEYGVAITPIEAVSGVDGIVLAVAHREYVARGWALMQRIAHPDGASVFDLKGALPRADAPKSMPLWRP